LTVLARGLAKDAPEEPPVLPPPRRARVRSRRTSRRMRTGRILLGGFVTIVVAAGLAWVGSQIVAAGVVDHRVVTETSNDVVTVSGPAALLDQFALDQVKRGDAGAEVIAARDAAETALREEPLDSRAVGLLAMIAERRGDRDRADALMTRAGARTWHDPLIESWLLVRDLQKRDFNGALEPMDALLRTHGLQPGEAGMLVQLAALPTGLNAIVNALAAAPPWRLDVMMELCAHLKSTDQLIALYRRLDQTAHRVTVAELRPYLNRLIAVHLYSDAYEDWVLMGPAKHLADLEQQPYNGDFALASSGLPFDWTLDSVPGAQLDLAKAPDEPRRALHLQFSGARVDFANVSEVLLLAPGDYHFTGLAMSKDLQTTRGLWWRIACMRAPDTSLAETALISGTKSWSPFDVDFRVPRSGCEAQKLSLELPARTASEHQIDGEAWYSALHIAPRPAPRAAALP
jgi:hypothetical protein